MNTRRLGDSDIQTPPLILGGNVFGWTIDAKTSFAVLDALVDAGFSFIDTADVYSIWVPGNRGGESETILGQWFKRSGKRDRVTIATKVGWEIAADRKGLSKRYILQAVEGSLQRLQTDRIDLYQSHVDDPQTPPEETLGAYAQLVTQGKVRFIGASNFSSERLEQSLEKSREMYLPRYQSLQPCYNLYDRAEYEENLEQVCIQHGLGVIPYFSLASGFLTGKYRSDSEIAKSKRAGMLGKYANDRGFRIVRALNDLARSRSVAAATIALAWLIARPSVTAPIASATSVEQLRDLTKAVDLKLSKPEIDLLNTASAGVS